MRLVEHNATPIATSAGLTAIAIPVELAIAYLTGAPAERAGALFLGMIAAGASLGAWASLADRPWTRRDYVTRFISAWAAWNLIAFVWTRL